jgi:hypothetical protein
MQDTDTRFRQNHVGHGSLFVQFPAVVEALREISFKLHLVMCGRAVLSKTQAYTGEMGQGFSRFRTEGALSGC